MGTRFALFTQAFIKNEAFLIFAPKQVTKNKYFIVTIMFSMIFKNKFAENKAFLGFGPILALVKQFQDDKKSGF